MLGRGEVRVAHHRLGVLQTHVPCHVVTEGVTQRVGGDIAGTPARSATSFTGRQIAW